MTAPSTITYTAPCDRCGKPATWTSAVGKLPRSTCPCDGVQADPPGDGEGGERPDMPGWAWIQRRARAWVA